MSQDKKNEERTLGNHLASRLTEIGIKDLFCVPGDFNMTLIDQLIAEKTLRMINCPSELTAGYAADGYARAKGVSAVVVTFMVGGLSIANAIAGAYAENVPVILITGCPNSNDFSSNRILHHTLGLTDFQQELRMLREITCHQATITSLDFAYDQIDGAITAALTHSKPVLIQVCSNLSVMKHTLFEQCSLPFALNPRPSKSDCLKAAVDASVKFLSNSSKPVLLGGADIKVARAEGAFLELANASKYAVAMTPNAKGQFPESHDQFAGIYWAVLSSEATQEVVESSDAIVFVGPLVNDYNTAGYSHNLPPNRTLKVEPHRVTVGCQSTFGFVEMSEFLTALAKRVQSNTNSADMYKKQHQPASEPEELGFGGKLKADVFYHHIQRFLQKEHTVMVDTGDALFFVAKMRLPEHTRFEAQMHYASIGWSVGASVGYQTALPDRRIVNFVGDGSFQVTAVELSTALRYGLNPIIFLLNNRGYTIEEMIHKGPYNQIANWDYCGFAMDLANGAGKLHTARVKSEDELKSQLQQISGIDLEDHCCFIEICLEPDDCSKELLEFGARLGPYNARPPVQV
ncbi:hypothetical protein WJX84_010850 [Apatococcus fuscideae]|uniref:pyruvate decarboxylase n=1 Tax=Apatococcus fuscideae TaxID=2026836 RepID=A0AAW1TAV9_9CHLO